MEVLITVLLGMGTVFIGLILLVCLVQMIGWFCKKKEKQPAPETASAIPSGKSAADPKADRDVSAECDQQIIAVIAVAIAAELRDSFPAFRIASIKKCEQ